MKTTNLLLLLLFLFTACCKLETKNETEKKDISLQLYSLRDDIKKDYFGTISRIGEMGFTAVEAAGYKDGKFYGRSPEEFKKDIETAGMRVLSSHAARQLSKEELKSKDFTEALKWWDECIAAHKAAGMSYVVIPWMFTPESIADLQTYCDYYNQIGERCKESGLFLGYHNHAHEFKKIEGQIMYDYLLENTNPDLVFFEMDVYWVVMGLQSPVDYFKKYAGRFLLLHIKDKRELGESGMLGFDAIFKNLAIAGTKNLIVEVEQYSFAPIESVEKSLKYMLDCDLVEKTYE